MSYAESLNSSGIGRNLTKSMENIKLSNEVSPAEVQSMMYKYGGYGKNKDQTSKTDSFTASNSIQPQNNQTYQVQQNYQPVSYQAPSYNQASPIQYQNYQPIQSQPVSYMQNVPVQYQNYQMTNSYPLVQSANNYTAPANAINAYSAQNQPQQSGQNLNVTTQNQPV